MTKPILVREVDGRVECGPSGLKLIEEMAAQNKTVRTIAVALGLSHSKFNKMLDRSRGENAERLAWEKGRAVIEQSVSDRLYHGGMGHVVEEESVDDNGNKVITRTVHVAKSASIEMMFFAKTQLGWNDRPDNKVVNNDNRVQLVLPKPMSTEEYYKTLGITAPLDFRSEKDQKEQPPLPFATEPRKLAAPVPKEEDKP